MHIRFQRRLVLALHGVSIPDALYARTGDNLHELARAYVPDFDEVRVEQQDVCAVKDDAFGNAFPLNDSVGTTDVAMFVTPDAKPSAQTVRKSGVIVRLRGYSLL